MLLKSLPSFLVFLALPVSLREAKLLSRQGAKIAKKGKNRVKSKGNLPLETLNRRDRRGRHFLCLQTNHNIVVENKREDFLSDLCVFARGQAFYLARSFHSLKAQRSQRKTRIGLRAKTTYCERQRHLTTEGAEVLGC